MATSMTDLVLRLSAKDDTGPGFRSAAGHADALDKKLIDVDGSMQKLSQWGKAGALALGAGFAVAGAAAAKFGVAAVNAASDFGEVSAAIEQTFGTEAAGQLQDWAKTSATALGQSKTQALDAAKTFGVFGKAAGLTGPALAGFSTDLTELATDLASFSNTTPEEAIEALGAGLRGESEPLRRYGVLLDDATLKARAMSMGIFDGTGSLTQQQRVLAAQAEILAQTSLQQGDFARTQGGMANQLRNTTAQWENIKVAAGAALVPIAEQYLPMVNDGLASFATWIETNMPQIQATLTGWADKVIELYPQVADQFGEIAATVQANWPDIVDTAENIGAALERVAGFTGAMWDAFRSLPPEAQQLIALLAVAQKTGVISVAFSAADLVKSMFAGPMAVTTPVVNVNGVPGGAAGTVGKASSLLRGALMITAVGAVTVAGTQVLIDTADSWASKAQADYKKNPTVNSYSGIATPDHFAIIEATKAMEGFVWTTDKAASSEAALALRHREQLAGLQSVTGAAKVGSASLTTLGQSAALAAEHANRANETTAMLATTIGTAGTAAGLTQQQIGLMSSAAMAVPADASVDDLANTIRGAGEAAGLSAAQTDTLAAAAYAVPGSANLPALKAAIDAAGASGAWTTVQTNVMSAAVAAIPPGATAAQMGEAIRVAGVKAGLTDQQIQGVTAAVNAVPANKSATITTNAPEEQAKVTALQSAINGLVGKNISVGVSLSGAATGGSGGSAYTGGAAGVAPWLNSQVDDLAESLAPKLIASGNIGSGPWVKPVGAYTVSSEWMRGGTAIHYGIDLAAAMGTPVHAASAGVVTQSGWNNGYGNYIAIDHGGIQTTYAHMSALLARAGQAVGAGAIIGAVGSTGDSTGPHLHFETRPGGSPVEPRAFMAARGVFLASGGMVPVNVSAGEYFVPEHKAKPHLPLLHALNEGRITGPGTATSDSIQAKAPAGSFVVNAAAATRHRALLDRITRGGGRSQYLASGGPVGGPGGTGTMVAGGTTVQLLIDGRALHESLIRYQRESGARDLFPVRP